MKIVLLKCEFIKRLVFSLGGNVDPADSNLALNQN